MINQSKLPIAPSVLPSSAVRCWRPWWNLLPGYIRASVMSSPELDRVAGGAWHYQPHLPNRSVGVALRQSMARSVPCRGYSSEVAGCPTEAAPHWQTPLKESCRSCHAFCLPSSSYSSSTRPHGRLPVGWYEVWYVAEPENPDCLRLISNLRWDSGLLVPPFTQHRKPDPQRIGCTSGSSRLRWPW